MILVQNPQLYKVPLSDFKSESDNSLLIDERIHSAKHAARLLIEA